MTHTILRESNSLFFIFWSTLRRQFISKEKESSIATCLSLIWWLWVLVKRILSSLFLSIRIWHVSGDILSRSATWTGVDCVGPSDELSSWVLTVSIRNNFRWGWGGGWFHLHKSEKYHFHLHLFIYLFTVRDLSLETDKIYPSTRLLLAFLLQNNNIYIV